MSAFAQNRYPVAHNRCGAAGPAFHPPPSQSGPWRRPMRHIAVASIGVLSMSVVAAARPAAAPIRKSPAQICKQSVAAFEQLPAPATVQDAEAGLARIIVLAPSIAAVNNFTSTATGPYQTAMSHFYGSPFLLDPSGVSARSIPQALASGDGPLATKLLTELQAVYTGIDRAQKKEKVASACASQAFGSGYVAQVAALVQRALPLTGDFVTDTNAACSRFNTKSQMIQSQADLTTATGIEDVISGYDEAFHALQIDVQAIAPPPGNPPAYAAFRSVIDKAVQNLDNANKPSTSRSDLQRLGPQITALAQPITAAASALGLNC